MVRKGEPSIHDIRVLPVHPDTTIPRQIIFPLEDTPDCFESPSGQFISNQSFKVSRRDGTTYVSNVWNPFDLVQSKLTGTPLPDCQSQLQMEYARIKAESAFFVPEHTGRLNHGFNGFGLVPTELLIGNMHSCMGLNGDCIKCGVGAIGKMLGHSYEAYLGRLLMHMSRENKHVAIRPTSFINDVLFGFADLVLLTHNQGNWEAIPIDISSNKRYEQGRKIGMTHYAGFYRGRFHVELSSHQTPTVILNVTSEMFNFSKGANLLEASVDPETFDMERFCRENRRYHDNAPGSLSRKAEVALRALTNL